MSHKITFVIFGKKKGGGDGDGWRRKLHMNFPFKKKVVYELRLCGF
jgi:hypothetical protein